MATGLFQNCRLSDATRAVLEGNSVVALMHGFEGQLLFNDSFIVNHDYGITLSYHISYKIIYDISYISVYHIIYIVRYHSPCHIHNI